MSKAGGKRENAGRKSKAEELKLIEKLTPYEAKAVKLLFKKIDEEDMNALKMYFEYMYGKPKQQIEQESTLRFKEGFNIKDIYGSGAKA